MTTSATYSPEDDKLRLYASTRLDKETYERARSAGFRWAPKQELFFAVWNPRAEDLALELAGEIDDEDKSLVERAEERADRFEDYSGKRLADAENAREAVHRIADAIPFGQPILVGHHSEKHARKDAEKIENGMRKAVRMWETSKYWTDRAAGALRHAKYKERPDVRARRIKTLEADLRKQQREHDSAELCVKFWSGEMPRKGGGFVPVDYQHALAFCNGLENLSKCFTLAEYPRNPPASQYEGMVSLWSALGGSDGPDHAIISVEKAGELSIRSHRRSMAHRQRWIAHLLNRIAYERAMLAEAGGTETDKKGPEVGGGVRCWASPGRYSAGQGYSYIKKVNRVSVTIEDNWGNGNPTNFTRTMPFDKCRAVVSRAEVEAARAEGRLIESPTKTGFYIVPKATPDETKPPTDETKQPAGDTPADSAGTFEGMRETLRAGVKVISAPQLFPTPPELAARMVSLADIQPGQRVLEPSAGTGNIAKAIFAAAPVHIVAVELNQRVLEGFQSSYRTLGQNSRIETHCADFLECNGELCGPFDRIIMNPPFADGADIKHIRHAMTMIKPGGRIVAICANGSRQQAALKPLAEGSRGLWEELPEGTFAGTGVRAVLAVFNEGPEASR